MARVKIKFPAQIPLYTCNIPVRISDVNYGGHLGNDALLSIIHEARMQMLAHWGYDEMNAGGNSLIMGDVMIAYRGEAFYGDDLQVNIFVEEIMERSFDMLYHIFTTRNNIIIDIAHAKTGMVLFDYQQRKITTITEELKLRISGVAN